MVKKMLLLLIVSMAFIQPSEAFFDMYKAYSTRNRAIKNSTIAFLNQMDKYVKWEQLGMTLPDEDGADYHFIPEGDVNNNTWRERFSYTEIETGRRKSHRDLEGVWEGIQNNHPVLKEGYKNVLFRNDKEIHFEIVIPAKIYSSKSSHMLGKLVQVGPLEFKLYDYQARGNNLTEDEKKQWFQAFNKAESIINNIPN